MKKSKIIFIALLTFLFYFNQSASGQMKIGIYSGFGLSAFEDQSSGAETLPIGLQVYYSLENVDFANLNLGLDFNYSLVPFSFDVKTNTGTKLFSRSQKQLHIGALIKIKFLKRSKFNPFLRLGMGLYSGGHTLEYPSSIEQEAQQKQVSLPSELDVSSGLGFNFGAGLDYKLTPTTGLFTEFVYHIVSRELNESPLNVFEGINAGKSSLGMNNWAILVGFQSGFNLK